MDYITSDMSELGSRDIAKVSELLNLYSKRKFTRYFDDYWSDDGTTWAFNKQSGYVFLTNSEYQAAMPNKGKLDIFENCPEDGHEGFPSEFKGKKCEGCKEIYQRYKESK